MKTIDKKLWYFLLLIYIISFLYGLGFALVQKYYLESYSSFNLGQLIIFVLYNYGTKFLFITVAIFFTKYLIDQKVSIFGSLAIHVLLTIVFSAFSSLMLGLSDEFIETGSLSISVDNWINRILYASNYNFFIYIAMIAIVYAYYYFIQKQEQQIQQVHLRNQLLDSRLLHLQSQLNPHFLFNTLNSVSALVDEDKVKSQEAIADLSDMLRFTLELNDSKFIPLEKELFLIKKYLSIQKLRYDEKLNWLIEVPEDLLDMQIPPLMLQPILENSIVHGFGPGKDQLLIKVSIKKNKEILCIKVSNNGKFLTDDVVHYGTGLANIIERLETLFGKGAKLELKMEGKNVVTEICMPA